MSRYRKKPVVIEAMRLGYTPYKAITEFCPDMRLIRESRGTAIAFGVISTLEGDMRAELGDWIIKGIQGEFYPCKPDIFEQTYEQVDP